MKIFTCFLILLQFFTVKSFSQELKGFQITLKATQMGGELLIETRCYENEISIIYKIKDSVSKKLDADIEYKTLANKILTSKNLNPKNDTLIRQLNTIDSITQAYTVYSKDSLRLNYNDQPEYQNLLLRLIKTSTSELENTEYNKQRIVMDGTWMRFRLSKSNNIRTVYASSPNSESHPILYDFIIQTLNLYRNVKQNDILSKKRIHGY